MTETCLPISLFCTELNSNHPLNSPTERKNSPFFLSKPKSNAWRKNLLRWGSQPCEIPSCEIGAHLAWSQWFRWKIPLQGETEITKTPLPLSHSASSFPLTPSHYSLPHSFIHLSELLQAAASYVFPSSGFISTGILITGFISNLFKIPHNPLTFLPSVLLLPCSFAPFSTSSLLGLISSFLPPLHLFLLMLVSF